MSAEACCPFPKRPADGFSLRGVRRGEVPMNSDEADLDVGTLDLAPVAMDLHFRGFGWRVFPSPYAVGEVPDTSRAGQHNENKYRANHHLRS